MKQSSCVFCKDRDNGEYICATCLCVACACCIGECEGCGEWVCAECAVSTGQLDPGCEFCAEREGPKIYRLSGIVWETDDGDDPLDLPTTCLFEAESLDDVERDLCEVFGAVALEYVAVEVEQDIDLLPDQTLAVEYRATGVFSDPD